MPLTNFFHCRGLGRAPRATIHHCRGLGMPLAQLFIIVGWAMLLVQLFIAVGLAVPLAQLFFVMGWKNHFRLLSQPPFSFLFLCENEKTLPPKNPLANGVKKHARLPSQPPSHFFFCAKTKKNSAAKKSVCEWREETRQTFFQSRRRNHLNVFRHSDSRI